MRQFSINTFGRNCGFWLNIKLTGVFLAQLGILVLLAHTFPYRNEVNLALKAPQPAKQSQSTGYFHIIKDFTNENGLARWDVSAADLSIMNGRVGIFTTYMNRKTYIKGLKLRIQTQSRTPREAIKTPSSSYAGAGIGGQLAESIGKITGNPQIALDLDSSNVFSLLIEGFSCEVFDEEKLLLSIHCKRASIADKKLSLLLEGGVVITTDEGKTLKANKVKWDAAGNSFAAQGPCLLTSAGGIANGRDITLNYKGCNFAIPF